MTVFVKALNILPLLNSEKPLCETDAKELFKCQKTDFKCVFDDRSTLTRKNESKSAFLGGLRPTCIKLGADLAKTADFSPSYFPCFSKNGESASKTTKSIGDVVDCFSEFYKNYVLDTSNPTKSIERLGASLLIYDFFKERYDSAPPALCKRDCGKPFFADFPVEVSISHSGGLVCCAFAEKKSPSFSLGIDAEAVPTEKKLASLKRIAEKFFDSELNTELLNGLSESDFRDAFTLIWTKKESLVKMTGEGLSGMKKEPSPDCLQSSYELSTDCGKTKYYISLSLKLLP